MGKLKRWSDNSKNQTKLCENRPCGQRKVSLNSSFSCLVAVIHLLFTCSLQELYAYMYEPNWVLSIEITYNSNNKKNESYFALSGALWSEQWFSDWYVNRLQQCPKYKMGTTTHRSNLQYEPNNFKLTHIYIPINVSFHSFFVLFLFWRGGSCLE